MPIVFCTDKEHTRCLWPALLLALVLCACASTRATDPLRLRYAINERAKDCPDAEDLQVAVSDTLGYDPWEAEARRTVMVNLTATGDGLTAVIELHHADGAVVGRRVLHAALNECQELGSAVALAIGMAIDPLRASSQPKPEPEPEPKPKPKPKPKPESIVSKPAAGQAKRPQIDLGVGGLVAAGAAPGITGGLQVLAALRWQRFSLGLAGRYDFPAYEDIPGGRISARLAGGSALACGHNRKLFACGGITAAALVGEGHDLDDATAVTLPYIGASIGAGALIRMISRFSLRPYAELLFPLSRATLEDSTTKMDYWTTPGVSGSVGLSVMATFF
jgi:hypothetical protein